MKKILFLSLLILFVAIITLLTRPSNTRTPIPTNSTSHFIKNGWFYSNIENIKLKLPPNWTISNLDQQLIPIGFKNPNFILKNHKLNCFIIQSPNDNSKAELQIQLTKADRVTNNYYNFYGSWFVAKSESNQHLTYSYNIARNPTIGEFRTAHSGRHDQFVLFTTRSTPVPESCNQDLNTILLSLEPYFENYQITSDSKGFITAEKVWDDVNYTESNKSFEHLVFIDQFTQEKRELLLLPKNTWYESFYINNNSIYTISITSDYDYQSNKSDYNSAIIKINPFDKSINRLNELPLTNTYISSLILNNNSVYFLAGTSEYGQCVEGYRPCPSKIYRLPVLGGTALELANSEIGGSLLSYDDAKNIFYIARSYGDAGCVGNHFERIVNFKPEKYASGSHCYNLTEDDRADQVYIEKINTFLKIAKNTDIKSTKIKVENSRLLPFEPTENGNYIFSNTSTFQD